VPCELPKSFGSRLAVANLQDECLAFDIAKLPQPLPECFDEGPGAGWTARSEQPDLRDLGPLLGVNGEPGSDDDSEEEDEDGDRSQVHQRPARPVVDSSASDRSAGCRPCRGNLQLDRLARTFC